MHRPYTKYIVDEVSMACDRLARDEPFQAAKLGTIIPIINNLGNDL